MAVARYHITPNGPKLCSASVRSCPYGDHFDSNRDARQKFRESELSAEQLYRENQPASKYLHLGDDRSTTKVVRSENWGAGIADLIDEHIEQNSVKPEQIEFLFYWDENSPDGDASKTRRYLFEAVPRLDSTMGKFTNIYRFAWWNPSDKAAQEAIDFVYADEKGRDSRWARVPDSMKWEAALGDDLPETGTTRTDHMAGYTKLVELQESNRQQYREVLNKPNVLDTKTLAWKLRDPALEAIAIREDAMAGPRPDELKSAYLYERNLERKAQNVVRAIRATETNLIGAYNAYDRGIGFYSLDNDRRTVVDEDLSTTFVRGRNLHQLGLESERWITGTWRGDTDRDGNEMGSQSRFNRVADSGDKGIPFESPMSFWTANTPDGARWELGMDVRSPEAGSNRVSYYEASNPSVPTDKATPLNAVDGFAAMRDAMEERYGESANWSPALQRDMKVLADIAEGHNAMILSAETARKRVRSYGFDKPETQAKQEHASLFGGLGKLFG